MTGILSLEDILIDELRQADVLRRNGHGTEADIIERIVGRVDVATEEFRTFVPETDARLRTNKSSAWLRSRYAGWATAGHAKTVNNVRQYRLVVLPVRADVIAAREAGRRAARAS